MAPKSKQGVLARVHAACKALELEKVTAASWSALREAECALSLDLQVDIEHVSAEKLHALAKSLEPLRTGDLGAELWQWLAQPAGTELGSAQGIPLVRALLVVLGQVCGNSNELVSAAGAAYLALLAVQGADMQWSILYQPGIFRQILRALRGLRRGELKAKKDKKDASGAEEEVVVVAAEAEATGGEEDAAATSNRVPVKDALELLGKLGGFFLERGLGCSVEAQALVVEEVAMLVIRPIDDGVARQASAALAALVARAGGAEDLRRTAAAAIRAVMPAVLMTQERLSSFPGAIPRPLQQARATALNFVCALVSNHPDLLTPQVAVMPQEEEEDEAAEEPPRKRGRRRGAKKGAEGEEEAGASDGEAAEGEAAAAAEGKAPGKADAEGAEGEKKSRRRRPRGNGVDDPIVALLELVCLLTPDRSEWRGYSVDSIITVLCQAADVERRLEMMGRITTQVTRRTGGKTKDPAWEEAELSVDLEDGGKEPDGVALPLCEAAGEGALVAPLGSEPTAPSEQPNSCERFLAFLERLLNSERISCRVLATEVAVASLERSGQLARRGAEEARAELVKQLLLALTRRCNDAVPSVRSRALGGVGTAVQFLAKGGNSLRLLRRIALEPCDPQHADLPGLFCAAAADEKPMVRKASLTFFDAVAVVLKDPLGLDVESVARFFDLDVMVGLSADESIMVRKACVSSLALLLRTCSLPRVCELWVRNVLPLVCDVENGVAERALDELEAAVLTPLSEGLEGLPRVLAQLDSEATEYLQRGLQQLAKRHEGHLPRRFIAALTRGVEECLALPIQEWPVALWAMLEEVTAIDQEAVSFELVFNAWTLFSSKPVNGAPMVGQLGTKMLRSLEHLVPAASQERMAQLLESVCGALASLAAPTSLIRALMCTVERVEETWKAMKLYAKHSQERAAWRASFLKSIQVMLSDYVRADVDKSTVEPQRLCSALFSLGELALMDISIISQGVVTQVQTIATNTIWRHGERVDTEPAARGQAFATLGKFCLRKDTLAKKSMELLVLHLNPNESFVVRNNVLIVLGDLCIHYTSLVDRFVPCMTGLLQDSNELLRKQAAMTLAGLLSEDFIKFRGSIMLRFLYVLSDPSDPVRSFVECVFARILHARNATMFSQSFLDVICAMNGWAGLPNFQGATGNEDFSLQRSPSRRAMIYRFMLTLMSNDQKFNVCAQIVTTLLAAFVDAEETIELPRTTAEPAGQALSDGLALLCCREMRICFTTQKAGQDEDGEVEGAGDRASAEAARGVLSSILKRNMCENIVPVLIQLKNLMEARHSPFLRQLRHCLREILRDFKDDLKDMLAGDAQLANEIAFDLKAQDDQPTQAQSQAQTLCPDADKQLVPHVSAPPPRCGAARNTSRRVSLGSMMKTPNAKDPTPLADLESPARGGCGSIAGSVIPKARRSSLGSTKRKSCAEEIQLDSSPRPLVQTSNSARKFLSPAKRRTACSPPRVPALPLTESQESVQEDVLNIATFTKEATPAARRGGKRKRGAQGSAANTPAKNTPAK